MVFIFTLFSLLWQTGVPVALANRGRFLLCFIRRYSR